MYAKDGVCYGVMSVCHTSVGRGLGPSMGWVGLGREITNFWVGLG